jgi:N-methylhydantoinase B/oxoprolinase/acetone carboxylase alpha subunit
MTVVSPLPLVRRATRGAALLLSLVGALSACATQARTSSPSGIAGGATLRKERLADAAPGTLAQVPLPSPVQVAQQLIRRGDMALQVDDVSATARRVERLGTIMGGVVAQSSDDGKDDAHVSLRVPSDRLDEVMDSVSRYGHVERRTTNSNDVTETLLDLDGRIASLAATRDRLRQLLARSEAIRDVLEVERELGRVQAELESLERRSQGLRGQVAMSDLSVDIDRRIVLGPIGQLFRAIGVGIGKLFVWK